MAASNSCSPSRGGYYRLLGAEGAKATSTHETRLLRWMGLCAAGLLLLDIWAWVAPGVLAPKGTEHTVADFDTSSLLYLGPLTLHALAALAFFTRKTYPHPVLALWGPALRLRATSLACMALAIPTLVARVVTLQQYCRMEGKVAEKEPAATEDGSELFKACATGHAGANAAAMAVAYTLLGVLTLQALGHLLALARWQHQQQHHLRAAYTRQRQAAARAAHHGLSHDGHTPPNGCGRDGKQGEEEWVEFWPPEQDDAAAGGLLYHPYYAPPLFFSFNKNQQRGGGGWQPRTPAWQKGGSWASEGTTSFGSSSLASYQSLLHPNRAPALSSSAANSSYYHPPGVSAAAAATARTLYGDVEQYDEPAPAIVVHAHHNGHVAPPSPLPPPQDDEADGVGSGGGQQGQGDSPGAHTGAGGHLTLSSGGQASAFSSYVAGTSTTD